jgi:uncharacterized protein (TIGR00661 family)
MNILYGVQGIGMGHATRSHVILDHLSRKHDIHIIASAKAYNYLSKHFDNVTEIEGFEFDIDDNTLSKIKSVKRLIRHLPVKSAKNLKKFIETAWKFTPDAVISDFESFSYMLGKIYDSPVISIDNMQIIDRCSIEIPSKFVNDFLVAQSVVKNSTPGCYYYLITTFFYPEVEMEHTELFPPILREKILNARPSLNGYILAYISDTTNNTLIDMLSKVDHEFVVYGFDREKKEGNIQYRKFSEDGFINDISGCDAVMANSGFSLIGEAVFLKKPFLALPIKKQFEQIMNGIYLQKLGYGEYQMEITKEKVDRFINNLEKYNENLESYSQDGNRKIMEKLDYLLDYIAKNALQ